MTGVIMKIMGLSSFVASLTHAADLMMMPNRIRPLSVQRGSLPRSPGKPASLVQLRPLRARVPRVV
jgi:hypothetical protein